jgi:hypothetical protein
VSRYAYDPTLWPRAPLADVEFFRDAQRNFRS